MLMQKFQQVAPGVPAGLQLCCATNPAAIPQAAMSHHSSPWHPIFYVATYSNCRQKQEIKVWKFKCKVFDKKLKVRSVVGLKTSRTIFTRFGQTDVKIEQNNNSSAARKIHIYVNIIEHISWAKNCALFDGSILAQNVLYFQPNFKFLGIFCQLNKQK